MARSFLILGADLPEREKTFRDLYLKFKPKEARLDHDPDLITLEGANSIGIDLVRHLETSLVLKSHSFPPKIGYIIQAEKLTIEAQNALLKVLEEPTGDSILILTAPRQENLLTTVVSRCQLISLPERATLKLNPTEIKDLSRELETILKSSAGKRIQLNDQFKTRDEAIAFCQTQLVLWREILINKIRLAKSSPKPLTQLSTSAITKTIRQLEKTLQYLKANANPRLCLDNLLLDYPYL